MSVMIEWNGLEYDVDPSEFTAQELSLIKERTGLRFAELAQGGAMIDADAIRALFWINDYRRDSEVRFSEYPGPPMKVFLPHLEIFTDRLNELGKALPDSPAGTDGSGGSESSTDSPPTTSEA